MPDVGLTHVALPVSDPEASVAFYRRFGGLEIVHERVDAGTRVVWLADGRHPFVLVLIEAARVDHPLLPMAHLGVGCASREEVDRLCGWARAEGCLRLGPTDSGPPVGYWALLSDPDGHTLELSFGQEIGAVAGGRP